MARPPALRLQLNNHNPETLKIPTPFESFLARLYEINWRKGVLAVTAFNALRFFLAASNAYQDVGVDKKHHLPKLARMASALCAMYTFISFIEVFGVLSVSMQRQIFIRVYAYLAFIAALLVTVAGFVGGVSYFVLADDLVHLCVDLSASGKPRHKSVFRGEPWPVTNLPPKVAHDICLKAWNAESLSQILFIFLFSVIPSIAYILLAYTYYRQVTDPSHPAYLPSQPTSRGSAMRLEALPQARYSPLYNSRSPMYSDDITDALRVRTPKNRKGGKGKGKAKATRAGKGRSVPGLHIASPVMRSASPYMMSPGPPSFSIVGLSRDYRPAFFRVGSDA